MTAIQTTLSNTNLTMTKLELIKTLIQTYLPGIGGNIYKGIKSIGAEDLVLPCIMIQPVQVRPMMITSAKYHKYYTYDIYWWVGNDNIEMTVTLVSDVGEFFQKLFSNNALDDLGTTNTSQFKTYSTNWVDSQMSEIRYGPPLYNGNKPGRPKYAALGYFRFDIQTVAIT